MSSADQAVPHGVPQGAPQGVSQGLPSHLYVDADGGSRGNPGPAGYGAVVSDARTGEVLARRAGFIGTATNNVAEYNGLINGLKAAKEVNPQAKVRVRMDSQLVVNQMLGEWKIKDPNLAILADFARAAMPASQVTYEWIPRERNTQADALANEAMDSGSMDMSRQANPDSAPWGHDTWATSMAQVDQADQAPQAGQFQIGEPQSGQPMAPAGEPGQMQLPEQGQQAMPDQALPGQAGPDPVSQAQAEASQPPSAPGAAKVGTGTVGAVKVGTGTTFSHLDPAKAMTLVLVRHGVTELTLVGGLSGGGVPGPELTAQGQEMAVGAAEVLAMLPEVFAGVSQPTAIVTSPMVRTQQTAQIIGHRLDIEPVVDDRLREIEFGQWESLTASQVEERWPGDFTRWHSTGEFAPPGGESYVQVGERMAPVMREMFRNYAGRGLVVVGHAAMIRSIVGRILQMPPSTWSRLRVPPCSLTVLRCWPETIELVTLAYPTDVA